MKIKKAVPLGFVATLLFNQFSFAENPERTRFNQAVSLYQAGVASCLEAHKLRASNLEGAKQAFQLYEDSKNQAVNLSPQILTTTEFNIDRNIKLCEQAKSDILRSEAIPVIETAIDLCKSSKSALSQSKVEQSRHLFNQYQAQKQKAFELASDVAKVQSIRINVARCDKFENKLNNTELAFATLNQKISNEKSKAQHSYQLCNKGIESNDQANSLSSGTTKAKQLLAQSKAQLATVGLSALNSVDFFSDSTLGKKLIKEMERSKQCQTNLAKSIEIKEARIAKAAKIRRANMLAQQAKAAEEKQQKALYDKILYQQTEKQKVAKLEKAKRTQTAAVSQPEVTKNKTVTLPAPPSKEAHTESQSTPPNTVKRSPTMRGDWTTLVANSDANLDESPSKAETTAESSDEDSANSWTTPKKSGLVRDWTQLVK